MSRGPGRLSIGILDCIGNGRDWTAAELAEAVLGNTSTAAVVSVRRALRALAASGLVAVRGMGSLKLWRGVEAAKREQQKQTRSRTAREREARRRAHEDEAWRETFREARLRRRMAGDGSQRSQLAKILGMLGSSHDGEVLSAARRVEKLRQKMGKTWGELLGIRL
jgi:hypothetical protein